jgi:signal-transduction protein with cAMP-binding, CBS, and nucleotidyltransferase domain
MEEAVKQLTDIPAINRFLSYCRVRTVPSKTALIHAGDLPDVLYYIIRGSVEVMIEDEEGNEMVLAYLNKGQFFGEMGLFSDSQQRSAWVRTRTQCELHEGIVHDLEGQRGKRCFVRRRPEIGFFRIIDLDALDVADIQRIGQVIDNRIQHRLDALVFKGAAA